MRDGVTLTTSTTLETPDVATQKKILITGGAGFIGSHLAERLLAIGHAVTVIDDLSTGSWRNIGHLQRHPQFRVLVASAADRELMFAEVSEHHLVYHLASAVGVKLIIDQPVKTVETIYQTTDVVLSACARYRRPVVITSTSEVYGNSTAVPFREDADVVMGPTEKRRWAYACAKALDEFLALAHFYETSLPVFIARLFNTVGPRQSPRYGMVLPNFVRQALAHEPITVYGTGAQSRCFCSVFDIVEGLVRLPNAEDAVGRVVNLGSQEETTIVDLARTVVRITGSPSEIVFVPYAEAYGPGFDDMMRRVPDLTRASTLLGWSPTRSLADIITSIVDAERGSCRLS